MLVINSIPIQLRSQQENERVIRQTPLQVKFKIPSLHEKVEIFGIIKDVPSQCSAKINLSNNSFLENITLIKYQIYSKLRIKSVPFNVKSLSESE